MRSQRKGSSGSSREDYSSPADDSSGAFSRPNPIRASTSSSTSISRTSSFGSTAPGLPHRSRTDQLQANEPLGLNVVYSPTGERVADVVLVHGLGGTSRLTWSWKKDLSLFWPEKWLPFEPGMDQVRILTFGYNANFMSPGTDLFNIAEFANELLLQMKVGNDEDVSPLELGKVPIIFVVHSMGGLVVKKVGLAQPFISLHLL